MKKKKKTHIASNGKAFIKITCEGSRWVTLDELIPMQGELKTLSEEDFNKGTNSMVKYGFSFPFFVWVKNGEMRCLDGHQRDRILKKHREEGKKLPAKFPAVGIEAKDEKEAKEKILLLSSQYGRYTADSVYEFIETSELDFGELKDLMALPALNMDSFESNFYSDEFKHRNTTVIAGDGNEKVNRDSDFSVYGMNDIVNTAFAWYRSNGFPYPQMTLHEQMQQVNKLASVGQDAAMGTRIANTIADCYFPHRFQGHGSGKKTPIQAFRRDKVLKLVIRLMLENKQAVGTSYMSLLGVATAAQSCANYRPGVAMYIYRKYGSKAGLTIDPCVGYGGRMIGWHASLIGGEYFGVDPARLSIEAGKKMAADLKIGGIRLVNAPFEDIDLKENKIMGRAELVFTSPPYFAKEHYSDEPTQSANRYLKFPDWVKGFLRPFLKQSFDALKSGGILAVNIGDVRLGNKIYPLELLTCQYAEEIGFQRLESEKLMLGSHKFDTGEHIGSIEDDDIDDASGDKQIEQIFIFKKV